MASAQINQTQILIAQWKAELLNLERQLKAGEDCIVMLQEAQRVLRQDETQMAVEQALDLMIGSQLRSSLLNVEFMKERKQQLEEGIKQAESPIARARLVQP